MFWLVIDPVEHAIFESDEVPRRKLQIALAGRHQLNQRVLLVQRHQVVTQSVVRRMQRDCQRHRTVLRQQIHLRHDARGGNSDAASRQTISMVVQHGAQCRQQFRVVLQRLAHAHHHDIGNDALLALQMPAQESLRKPELGDDFSAAEVAAETLMPGGAEAAAHGAAGLRGDAQCSPIVFRNENRLHGVTAANVKQPLDGAVR